jgi:very-short-patch-repair endonuclease
MKHHTKAARRLRKLPTEAEQRLWSRLRGAQLGVAFRRQHPVKGTIVDFYAPIVKLAVEVDGGQHATAGLRKGIRTRALTGRGISVLRFWNDEVLENTDGVLLAIQTVLAHLAPQTPTLSLPLPGRGDASGVIVLQDLNLVLAENQR